MEFKVFEENFKKAGFIPRQIKKIQQRAYKEYEDGHGKRIATGGQKQIAYDFLTTQLYEMTQEELEKEMYSICRASKEQTAALYKVLEER